MPPPPPPKVTVSCPRAGDRRVPRLHRPGRGGRDRGSAGPGQGLPAEDPLPGRGRGQEGGPALRDRSARPSRPTSTRPRPRWPASRPSSSWPTSEARRAARAAQQPGHQRGGVPAAHRRPQRRRRRAQAGQGRARERQARARLHARSAPRSTAGSAAPWSPRATWSATTSRPCLTTIVRLDPVYVYFEETERGLEEYDAPDPRQGRGQHRPGQDPGARRAGLGEGLSAPGLSRLPRQQDRPRHRHHPAPRRASQPDRALTPGQFVRVRVTVGAARKRLLVPEQALGRDQTRQVPARRQGGQHGRAAPR